MNPLKWLRERRKKYPRLCDWLTDEILEEFHVYIIRSGYTLLVAKDEA